MIGAPWKAGKSIADQTFGMDKSKADQLHGVDLMIEAECEIHRNFSTNKCLHIFV